MDRPNSLRYLFVFLPLLFLLTGISGCAATLDKGVSPQPSANLVLTPNAGQARAPLAIRGSGFVPGEKIEVLVEIDGVPTELGEKPMIKEANEAGAFKTLSAIPVTAKPGMYTVKAVGDRGTIAVAPLEVESKPPAKQ